MSVEQIKKDAMSQKQHLSAIVADAIKQAQARVDAVEVSINLLVLVSVPEKVTQKMLSLIVMVH